MIQNLWTKIRLVCGNHDASEEPVYMSPHTAAGGSVARSLYGNNSMNMFYACPKYYPENRTAGEPLCRNHISMSEFENMLSYISSIIEEDEINGGSVDLVGTKWKSKKGVEFEIIRQTTSHIDVRCVDRRALWKK